MAEVLKSLGFQVELLTDASLDSMETAVIRLGASLSQDPGSYGFFYYAGHGIQSAGTNYLIPVDADLKSEAFLKNRALAAQEVLETLDGSHNALNIVVLDACRDNPFGWSRGGSRGLSVVSGQPPGSIIAFATSAGSVAQDGTGRNGLFTSQLMNNLKTQGLDIKEVFNRTGADVLRVSNSRQVPAIYSQFFGNAVLLPGTAAAPATAAVAVAATWDGEYTLANLDRGITRQLLTRDGVTASYSNEINEPASDWSFQPSGDGWFTVGLQWQGQRVNLQASNGADVELSSPTSSAWQQWHPIPDEQGPFFHLINKGRGESVALDSNPLTPDLRPFGRFSGQEWMIDRRLEHGADGSLVINHVVYLRATDGALCSLTKDPTSERWTHTTPEQTQTLDEQERDPNSVYLQVEPGQTGLQIDVWMGTVKALDETTDPATASVLGNLVSTGR